MLKINIILLSSSYILFKFVKPFLKLARTFTVTPKNVLSFVNHTNQKYRSGRICVLPLKSV